MRAIVSVIGKDQVGIIANVCSLLSAHQVNVLDISQTVLQEYFTMIMVVDTSACPLDFAALVTELAGKLGALGEEMGIAIRVQRQEIFDAMHRV